MTENGICPPEFAAVFHAHADVTGAMTFARFMEIALYDPQIGYYRRKQPRVGYGAGTDFFTASTSGSIFGELVVSACVTRLGGRDPRDFAFVEIGAENAAGILMGVAHPFGASRVVQLGQAASLTGRCVVFSNELFDAQPFHRYAYRGGAWRELGVAWRTGELCEVEMSRTVTESFLPTTAPENYRVDAPVAARELAASIAAALWTGLFVACDYGKSWRELIESCPAGTARAYRQHTQSNALLAHPGEQDLTCHICWDWMANALTQHGFVEPALDSQEAFFVRHAAKFIEATTAAEAARFSPKKLSLLQLLHPGHLGQKFQVLHAWRDRIPD